MAFSEIDSPVYGGGTIQLDLTGHQQLIDQLNVHLFLVFEGELQRHLTVLKHYKDNHYFSIIPAHHREESVQLSILCFHGNECSILGGSPFRFYYDSAFYMAQFLVESVYNVTALDDLELIRSDYFDLSNEILDTLDDRLQKALNFLDIPDWWHLLGSTSPLENPDNQTRETLLHFTARLGLNKVTLLLLNKPGSKQCLSIPNRHGNLPRDVAAEQGYTNLCEILTEYNSHFVKVENKPIPTDEGIISYYDNREVSLSTYLQRSIVEEAQILQKLVQTFEKSGSPSYVRQSETAWPETEEMDTDKQGTFEDQTDSKLRAIILKSKDLQVVMEALSSNDINSDNTIDLDSPARSLEDLSDTPSDRDTELQDGSQGYEGSLLGLHGFNTQLLQQRDSNRNELIAQDVHRKDNLSRFSSSCPSLEVEGQSLLPPDIDEDHHNSMLNLSKDEEHAGPSPQLARESPSDSEETTDSPYLTDPSQDTGVQICINGVTVDHSNDFTLDGSLNRFLRDFYGGNTPGVRRRSWGGNFLEGQKLQVRHARHEGSLRAKSMSLNSLDGEEDTEDDEYVDATEPPTPHVSQRGLETGLDHPGITPTHMDALSISPGVSPCSSPNNQDMPDASMFNSPDVGETLVRTLYGLKQELISPRDRKSHQLQHELGGQSGESADEDSRILTVPHSNITKSLSTPSIPAAVSPGERKVHKDPKQRAKLYRAQFRRQDEIEEDDDENTNRLLGQSDSRRRSQVSLIDFLADPSNLEDPSKSRKEEKKRKPSVFSRLQNSYRTKKHKDKENKGKSTHQFVSVSFSNSTACHVCRKSMANKPAVRCENCLVNVHENSCKEQITPCDKSRIPKVPPQLTRESAVQMTNVTLREKQSSSLPTSVAGLRQSHSFKEKRSSSGPAGRSQVTSAPLSVSTVTPQPHPSLSSIPDTESVTQTSAAQLQQHRRSLPTTSLLSLSDPPITQGRSGYWKKARELLIGIDKPISEDVDPFLSGQESGSNITDTISESLESLDETDAPSEVNDNYDDELLMLRDDEAETWSGSIDRKVIKKMSHKDIKRQDTIWELIQTERHHCRRLKILQRIYSHTILEELHMPQEVVDRLFPKLDDLIDIHMTFLHRLQDLQNLRPDHSVDQIGETIVDQFDGENAEQMKAAYGGFCCRQKSSNLYYKDLLTKDRKFQSYMKKCNNHTLCNKREIPDFLLAVTQRPSKYLTLIEAILKSTKDKKDRENLIKALNLSKDLLHSIDEAVNEYELEQRLEEIHTKMDQRAVAIYKGKKFKRSDIIANGRCLLHEGSVQLKNARGKVTDAILVVLTDLIFFMQEANGKYNFFSQDSKSSVIPLFQLLVREKGDTRADSRGIYLISQNKQNPEMYEFICTNNNYRRNWIEMLRQATDNCPHEEEEEVPNEEDEEQRRVMEARSAKVKEIIEQLHHKDREIKNCCDVKNKLMMELLEMYSWRVEKKGTSSEEDSTEHMDALQTAIQEVSATASRLTTMLQGSGSHLSRHVSSVGEHVSSGFSLTPLPKRAETFAGFDSSFDVPKGCVPKKKYLSDLQDLEGRSGSPQNVDSDSEICQVSEPSAYERTNEADDSLDSTRQYDHYSHSDAGSLGDISGSSTQSNLIHGENHLASITQLARSLHSIVHLTAQQGTAVETLRAQLAEANERINKLSAEVHERKGGYRYNQLEELRNLQEMVRKEKQAFEREKERERNYAEQERQNLEEMKQAIKLEEEKLERERREIAAEIQSQKDDLRQDKERYQAQIMLWESQLRKDGHSSAPGVTQLSGSESHDTHSDFGQVTKRDNSPSNAQANHRRSASADFCQMIENDMDRLRQGNVKTTRREMAASRSDSRAGLSSSASKKNLPEHLLSAKNEQKVSGIKVQQQIPTRSGLATGQVSSSSMMGKGSSVQQVLPFKLAASGSNSSLNSGAAGPQNSASQGQKPYNSRTNMMPNKQSSSSSLSRIMKLAEPGSSKGRSSSLTSVPSLLLGDKSHTHKSASVDFPNSGAPQGAAPGKTDLSSEKADDEIYC
ncbi:A-kinase anchor protein 13-like isoform X3 [Pecten maximus]|uniref:A-kinase anchor protein 13-like isoform X3 n=1 Tax=Pecten maximus TaxID=6579 RepID=UPI0014590933|nr:A-kinase anchor protein 13-like isoform X3 [Pecten maximus]